MMFIIAIASKKSDETDVPITPPMFFRVLK